MKDDPLQVLLLDEAILIKICKEEAGPERKGERKGASSASKSPGATAPARTYRLPPAPGRPRRAQLYQVGLEPGTQGDLGRPKGWGSATAGQAAGKGGALVIIIIIGIGWVCTTCSDFS